MATTLGETSNTDLADGGSKKTNGHHMTIAQLNSKIATLPKFTLGALDQSEAMVIRDTRLGILGVHAGMEPTEEQVAIVHDEIWLPKRKQELLPSLENPAKVV